MLTKAIFLFAVTASILGVQNCKTVEVEQSTPPPVDTTKYSCSGKTVCTEMNSCGEAKFYLQNCPGVTIDGDGDGIPCEEQWCR